MMRSCLVLLTLLLASVAGCSGRGAYDAVRESRKFECDNLPPSEQKKCLEQLAPPYDEYKREREDKDGR